MQRATKWSIFTTMNFPLIDNTQSIIKYLVKCAEKMHTKPKHDGREKMISSLKIMIQKDYLSKLNKSKIFDKEKSYDEFTGKNLFEYKNQVHH